MTRPVLPRHPPEAPETGDVAVAWTDDAEQLVLTIPRRRLEASLAREELETFVTGQVLRAVRDAYDDLLERSVAARPSRLRPVLAHMEDHAAQPLTPEDLARVGCMSVRTLHTLFRAELGVSPMAHLRRIRLDRVRADLLRGGELQRIGDVAVRWGFFHPSRFAQQYQERFGELPSDTVHGAPR